MIWALLVVGLTAAPLTGNVIHGIATDPSGAVVPGALVELTDSSAAPEATTVTDGLGRFVLEGVPPGRHQLRVALDGFAPYMSEIQVDRGRPALLQVRLALAAVA